MEKETCNKIYRVMVVTGVIGGIALLANSTSRKKAVKCVKEAKDSTLETVSFIRENRQELVRHIKAAANDIADLMKDVNEDIKVISESASHIKKSSAELARTTQSVASEFKVWKKTEEIKK